jgi:hypothetical protein
MAHVETLMRIATEHALDRLRRLAQPLRGRLTEPRSTRGDTRVVPIRGGRLREERAQHGCTR